MYRIAFAALLALAACSDREVGQSTYFDGPYVALENQSPRVQAQNAEVAAMEAQIAARQAELAAQRAASARQEALVASIESAIEDADNRAAGNVTMPSALPPQQSVAAQVPAAQPDQPVLQVAQQPEQQPIVVGSDGSISDNSFQSVTARETIESDAERLARLQQGTVVLEAEPLPETSGPNLAAFARSTTHRVGQRIYRRSGGRDGNAARTCRRYGNPDEAQRAFLSQGGPEKDKLGIDPDGDGFVCGWTPDPFRALRVGG